MIYLTYNDQPTGVYFSQVIDVCNYINNRFNCNIRLVALISIRGFKTNRQKIKEKFPKAIVLPMYPKNRNWKKNAGILSLLFLLIGKQSIWSRGVFATNIALHLKQKNRASKVIFDGRGAYKAEFEEYLHRVVTVNDDIFTLEKNAVNNSDFRLAVSFKLVDYWKENYNYAKQDHVVIPCTLNESKEKFPEDEDLLRLRTKVGLEKDDIVFIYSGSSAEWQSIFLLDEFMLPQFVNDSRVKLILLSNADIKDMKIHAEFPERIIQCWLKPFEVMDYLLTGDYGILLREDSMTNRVASPTKFAEYLNAGLKIILSDRIGDFSSFTEQNNCGVIITGSNKMHNFNKLSYNERVKNNRLAYSFFTKEQYAEQYQLLINSAS